MLFDNIKKIDQLVFSFLHRYGHWIHRMSLGLLFIWFGLLKPLGHKTTTSLLAHTVYWGDPETMVLILGWWEVTIGVCIIFRPLIRLALLLLIIRLPGIILAFILKTDVCFYEFPFAPTPEGQFLIKDLVIFVAALAIAGSLSKKHTPEQYH
jgi:uncharacterized membrane protein YkgB